MCRICTFSSGPHMFPAALIRRGCFPCKQPLALSRLNSYPQVWEQGLTFPSPLGWTPDLHHHGPASLQSGLTSHVCTASSLKCLAKHLAVVHYIFMVVCYSRTHIGVSSLCLSNKTLSPVSGDAPASLPHLLIWLPRNFFPVRVMEWISQRSRGCPIPLSVHVRLDKAWSNLGQLKVSLPAAGEDKL